MSCLDYKLLWNCKMVQDIDGIYVHIIVNINEGSKIKVYRLEIRKWDSRHNSQDNSIMITWEYKMSRQL